MCEIEPKLVAWLDGELSIEEAADVEQRVGQCEECHDRAVAYREVSRSVSLYCDAVMGAKTRPRVPLWAPAMLASATVVAAVVVLFVSLARTRVEPPPVVTPTAASISAAARPVEKLAARPVERAPQKKAIRHRPAMPPVQAQSAKWQPSESAVQIAIPAEAMFAPGAIPRGLNFVAELSIGSDGSVREVRLRQ